MGGSREEGGLRVRTDMESKVVRDVEIVKVRIHSSINDVQQVEDAGGGNRNLHIARVTFLHRNQCFIRILGKIRIEQIHLAIFTVKIFLLAVISWPK